MYREAFKILEEKTVLKFNEVDYAENSQILILCSEIEPTAEEEGHFINEIKATIHRIKKEKIIEMIEILKNSNDQDLNGDKLVRLQKLTEKLSKLK